MYMSAGKPWHVQLIKNAPRLKASFNVIDSTKWINED